MWPRGEDNYPRRHLSPHEDTVMDLVSALQYTNGAKYMAQGVYQGNKLINLSSSI